jgi:hypothetical protein
METATREPAEPHALGIAPVGEAAVAAWALAHKLTWEMTTRFETVAGRRTKSGLALTLAAQCLGPCRMEGGCPAGFATRRRLREIALSLIPDGVAHSFDPVAAAVHMKRAADWAPEVEATVLLPSSGPLALAEGMIESIRQKLCALAPRNPN